MKLNFNELISNNNYFKKQNNFIQCINLLKDKENFCFSYKSIEGCFFCSKFNILDKFYHPFIAISFDDIENNTSFEIIFNKIFQNSYNACINCGYGKDEIITLFYIANYLG